MAEGFGAPPPIKFRISTLPMIAYCAITATFDTKDKKALEKHLAGIARQHAATWREGLDATIVAIKTNEAIVEGKRIEFRKEWFEI